MTSGESPRRGSRRSTPGRRAQEGPIGYGDVHFETMKIGDEDVWAIAHLK